MSRVEERGFEDGRQSASKRTEAPGRSDRCYRATGNVAGSGHGFSAS